MRRIAFGLAAAAVLGLPAAAAAQSESAFQFGGGLGAAFGPSALSYFNGATTSGAVSFNSTSAFGITALPGDATGSRTVLSFPAFAQNQGLQLAPNVGPNGGATAEYINRYSLGYDLYLTGDNWFSFFQTNATNASDNDGDIFRQPTASGAGIGISGVYHGTLPSNQWHRVMFTFDLQQGGTPTLKKYIDGALVGTQTLDQGFEGRWAVYANSGPDAQNIAYILTDDSGDTTPGYISSFYIANFVLTDAQVAAFGGPTVAGFVPVPEPGAVAAVAAAGLGLAGLVRRRRRAAA
jgi:concanavalin A-like lectin/glucanase superfamily protein